MNLVGYAGVKTGVPYPVLARASFGVWGANLPALVRAIVACFWYGAQTAAASGAIVALLTRNDAMMAVSDIDPLPRPLRARGDLLRDRLGAAAAHHPERHGDGAAFQDWAGPAVWIVMLVLAIGLVVKAGGFSFEHGIPHDVLLAKTKDAGVPGEPGTFWALMAVGATWVTYFAALYLNFCDFSRFAPDKATVKKGNLWGLPINLVLFSLVAGVTTLAAFKVYGEVLLHPEQISAKFDNWFLALVAALTFAVATLGINVVANFVSPAFDFSNVFPRRIDFKKGGYIAAAIALVLYPFAPWEGNAAAFVGAIGATMGPLLGIILADYYLLAKGEIDVEALYQRGRPLSLPGRLERERADRRGHRRAVLEHPAELHQRAAVVVGHLRLVLRRRDRRRRLSAALDGHAASGQGRGGGVAGASRAGVAGTSVSEVPSPCTSVCAIDPASGWCAGCLRTLDEIAAWGSLDDAAKREVWQAPGSPPRRARAARRRRPDAGHRPGAGTS